MPLHDSEIKISVVIPAYNEADFLPRCLDSLMAQKKHQILRLL